MGIPFTRENAREMARRGNLKRWSPEHRASVAVGMPEAIGEKEANPLGYELSRVQWELVEQMKGNTDAKAVSALAQALKNVRETYHLVTGQAKPGVIRETGRNRRNQERQQAAPEPEVEETETTRAQDPGDPNG